MYRSSAKVAKYIAGLAFTAGLLLLPASQSFAIEKVYKTKAADGSMLFSDAPASNGAIQRTSYANNYGRPMATASCNGASLQIMSERAGFIEDDINAAASAHKVDPLLIEAIARVESCFDPHAVSVAGAQGLMQLMPATAAELNVTQPFNELQNLMGGAEYIAKMLKMFDSNLELALAAYNAGPGTVKHYGGIPPYKETQRYVVKVKAHYKLLVAAK
ncbi:MAG: lytic transglycosylase domain-containing protein [Granulosicoccaceae bacterium]